METTKPEIENNIVDGILIIPKTQQSDQFFKYKSGDFDYTYKGYNGNSMSGHGGDIEVLNKKLEHNILVDLKILAKTIGIKGYTKFNKSALVTILNSHIRFE